MWLAGSRAESLHAGAVSPDLEMVGSIRLCAPFPIPISFGKISIVSRGFVGLLLSIRRKAAVGRVRPRHCVRQDQRTLYRQTGFRKRASAKAAISWRVGSGFMAHKIR
jgi:hypothetical protein